MTLLQLLNFAEAQTYFSAISTAANKMWANPVFTADGQLAGMNMVNASRYGLQPTDAVFAWETAQGMTLMMEPDGGGLALVLLKFGSILDVTADPLTGVPQYYAPDTGQTFFACAFRSGNMYPEYLCVTEGYAFPVAGTLDGGRCDEYAYQDECDRYRDILVQGADGAFIVHHVEGTPSILSLRDETVEMHR